MVLRRADLEELRKQQAGGVGEMRAAATLDLREVGLADCRLACILVPCIFLLYGADELLLAHGSIETAEVPFDFTKVTSFIAEFYCQSRVLISVSQSVIRVTGFFGQ